ncbi:hypothetical protein N0V85_009371, partial [Neurospora sp. IMI 360204]
MVAIRRKASFSHDEEVRDTIHVCLSDHDTIHIHAPKPNKRRRTTKQPSGKAKSQASTTYPPLDPNTGAPIPDPLLDDVYRRLALSELEEELSKADATNTTEDGGYSIPTHGQRTQRLLHSLLQNASHPKTNFSPDTDSDAGPVEALYLNQTQATALIESPHYDPNVLLIVQDKRYFEPAPAVSFPLTSSSRQAPHQEPVPETKTGTTVEAMDRSQYRPISLFFNHLLPTLHRQVSVQIPSQPVTEPSGQLRTLRSIRARFHSKEEDAHEGEKKAKNDPWNVLDLSTPIPSTTPAFLQGPGSQLLRYIRSEVLMAAGSNGGVISPLPSPTTVVKSESGLVTPPRDSRGFTPARGTHELEITPTPEPNA